MISCTSLTTATPVQFLVGHYGATYVSFPSPSNGDVRCDDPGFITRRSLYESECESERIPNGVWLDVKFCLDANGDWL
jgi:hypothetical protein